MEGLGIESKQEELKKSGVVYFSEFLEIMEKHYEKRGPVDQNSKPVEAFFKFLNLIDGTEINFRYDCIGATATIAVLIDKLKEQMTHKLVVLTTNCKQIENFNFKIKGADKPKAPLCGYFIPMDYKMVVFNIGFNGKADQKVCKLLQDEDPMSIQPPELQEALKEKPELLYNLIALKLLKVLFSDVEKTYKYIYQKAKKYVKDQGVNVD